jgi:hypothetical protein
LSYRRERPKVNGIGVPWSAEDVIAEIKCRKPSFYEIDPGKMGLRQAVKAFTGMSCLEVVEVDG